MGRRKASQSARAALAAIAFLCAIVMIGCSSDATGVSRTPTSITISPPNAIIDALGATQSFQAVVRDQNGNPILDAAVQWSIQGGSVGTISSSGTVTAQANGSTQVTACASGLNASVTITVDQEVQSLAKISGDNQSGPVGSQLPQQLLVRARDRLNNAVSNVNISFEVSTSGGQLTVVSAATDANGDASTQWTLGTSTSTPHSVTARVAGSTVQTIFTANALAGNPSILEKVAGDGIAGIVETAASPLPTLRVLDAFGNPVSGASVLFQIINGSGILTGNATNTNSSGLASPGNWQLGNAPATNILRATVPMVGSADFSVNAVAGPPSLAVAHQGTGQSVPIGTGVPVLPGIRVTDAVGNGISGVAVTFAVTTGGGAITGANAVTDADGIARVGSWSMGVTPGVNSLTATAGALTPVVISATATVIPATVVIHAGNNQNATVGTNVAIAPSVRVTTAEGLAAPGVSVAFAITAGGGSLGTTLATTDANGVASATSWTLGTSAGGNSISASVASLSLVQFNATGNAGSAAALQFHAGNNQSAPTGTALPNDPAVKVVDQFGNGVQGASVAFTVTGGGGSINGTPVISNALGVATAGDWTLGPAQGANQLRAEVSGVPFITFNATGTLVPTSMVLFAGNNQSATVGTQVNIAPAVRVTGAGAIPVQGVSVTFSVTGGGGNIAGVTVSTDANGVAAVTSWTLGTAAGSNSLQASASLLTPVNFNATGTAGAPASIAVHQGNNQSAAVGAQVLIDPAVMVRDAFANGVNGVAVTFDVTGGGGSVSGAVTATLATGIATVGSWTLGAGANSLTATATGSGITNNPVTFSATGNVSQFNIELRFLTAVTQAQQAAFNSAVAKWQSIITGDIPQVNANVGAGQCGGNSPALNEFVDDLIIFVTLEPIDGAGSILGSAGPCWIRGSGFSYHPFLGRMRFDIADLATMEGNGLLEPVIVHEMGHVLGIGTLWGPSFHNMLVNPSLPSSPGVDTHLNAANAIAAFNSVGGGTYSGAKVPVENSQGGDGTRDAHWRESVFQNELMTGFVSVGANPVSLVTVRFLQDMGYVVNASAADAYTLPGGGGQLMDASPKVLLLGDVFSDPIRIGGAPPSSR